MDSSRRRVLAAIAAGGVGVIGGCHGLEVSGRRATVPPNGTPPGADPPPTGTPTGTSTDSPTQTPTPAAYDRVIDMVADEGVDPNGERPIDESLQAAAGNDTLLEFPPGTYLVTEPLLLQEVTNFSIRGTGTHPRDVRFVHPKGYGELFCNIRGGANSVLQNFTLDQTRDRVTNSGIIFLQRDGLAVTDVRVAGFTPSEGDNPDDSGSINLLPSVLDPAGTGTVTRFWSIGGGEVGVYPASYPGIYSGTYNRGTLRLVDCRVENCGGAGVYTSRAPGHVQVEGGLFRNSGVAQVRLAGEGSYIRGARIVVDTDRNGARRGDYETVRGVWWESGDLGHTGGVIENCEFVARSAPVERGLLEIDGTAGAMTVRDSTFLTDRDGFYAIYAATPGSSSMGGAPAKPWGVTVRNVRVRGTASGRAAIRIDGRPGSVLRGVDVAGSGAERNGVEIAASPGSRMTDSAVTVSRFPIRVSMADGPGDGPVDGDCRFTLGTDVQAQAGVGLNVVAGNRVDVRGSGSDVCLPPIDLGEGAYVVLGRCGDGFHAGVVDGVVPPEQRNTLSDCG